MSWLLIVASVLSPGEIVSGHARGVSYTRTDIESACGAHVIRIQYRNDWPRGIRGRVGYVRIDDRDIGGAAAGLEERAANRTISKVEIINCGRDERNPLIFGVMRLAEAESRQRGLPQNVYFRIRREDGDWRMVWE